ncbi:UvrD-helicase domain-containing protein [Aliivibrio finisterrensis]|uniref:UvrD-helicase domain-containing protein n=1 Tax=Aliivibrio finisterrensis TaxID=511998 RepID=UPI0010200889|nr:UvrD-helicase domain-containing protein [Aliivibrio finisterrensis]RYU48971.1 ATP-dependent helicase [Aliivibrio finisterrensis]RYU53987.1 ATP-dependent helicase [Aliivibrio finisterrensis]RYU79342.1 ATP-dependent helicase [Aliivibrio finisterrensis]
MDRQITPQERIQECIADKKSFVLQGGAGCGKTETLKETLNILAKSYPKKRIACITHTNLAANEIIDRVGEGYNISTIHSFLGKLIKNYTKAIHDVIHELFIVSSLRVETEDSSGLVGNELKKLNHENYKKAYKKYAKRKYIVKGETSPKELVKRGYDKVADESNQDLNQKIAELNTEIRQIIDSKDHKYIKYNDSRFDRFNDLSFGHDSLLKIATLLFKRYPKLGRILCDKYDFILIDEYQDTHEDVVEVFLKHLPKNRNTTVGLFGDAMQSIYSDGVGDVRTYITSGDLVEIPKEDNFRCSEQVIDFINALRDDALKQEPAFKTKEDGTKETLKDRQGEVRLLYAIWNSNKPHSRSSPEEKQAYLDFVDKLIDLADGEDSHHKKLMLTNKSIASKVGFASLYQLFADRYTEVKDEIEKVLTSIQALDLAELCDAYSGSEKRYNFILSELKKSGFVLSNLKAKEKIVAAFDRITMGKLSIAKTLEVAFEENIIAESDSYLAYVERKDSFLAGLKSDMGYQELKALFNSGSNTLVKMTKESPELTEEAFNEFISNLKRERFYEELFSESIPFGEIVRYCKYLNEKCDYVTMHKTKGSGIENVLVVLDEYFWNQYKFQFSQDRTKPSNVFSASSMKLFYVACSRTIKNLTVVKVVTNDEEKYLLETFPGFEKVVID